MKVPLPSGQRAVFPLDHLHLLWPQTQLPLGKGPVGVGVSLAGVGGAGGDLDPALGGHQDAGRVGAGERGDPAAAVVHRAAGADLVEQRDPDAEQPALGSGGGSLPEQPLVVRRLFQSPQQGQVVSGVEFLPMGLVHGNSRTALRRRSSSGSIRSAAAMASIICLVAKTAAFWPMPRQGPTGQRLLAMARVRNRIASRV